MGSRLKFASILIVSALAGCGGNPKLTDLALGKVVVYRNGVAYFERYADVENGEISLVIAESKVNDLLKSLKVEDMETGKALPMTFPGRKAGNGVVHMKIRVPGENSRRVKLSYVSESPAWKPTYRLDIDAKGKLVLQGWAIVDNVSGEDWKQVAVGVGSTSALSFRYDLWTVRDVHRQTLGTKERLAKAPPTATGLIRPANVAQNNSKLVKKGIVLDREYIQNIPVPGRTFDTTLETTAGTQSGGVGVSFSGSASLENQYVIDGVDTTGIGYGTAGAPRISQRSQKEIEAERKRKELAMRRQQVAQVETAKMNRRNDDMAAELLASDGTFVIEGIASPSQQNSQQIALSMANHLRNELITRGVPPTRVAVQTRIGAVGEPTTLAIRPEQEAEMESDDSAVGESKFLSDTPVSIPNQGSSMVSILDRETSGSIVYLYDALSQHGNKDFAFKLAAGAQKYVEISEFTTITATLDLTTDRGVEGLASYLRANKKDTRFTEAGTNLVKAHRIISKNLKRINHVAGQLAMLRSRMDELHIQLVTLEAVKTKGRIIRTLHDRMAGVSKQVQYAVMEIVELREQIMVDRFAYRDLITHMVELTGDAPDAGFAGLSSASKSSAHN
jgi:hypothetical protein